MRPIVKKIIEKVRKDRTYWLKSAKQVLKETKSELILLFGVSVHEYFFWNIHYKEQELLDKLKNLELYKRKLREDNIPIN
mmetsp:Transcript_361/g.633  ORF Transcript_361/g.633 Transcript_361/m.633 type:complete len:80 (-) Transcript_361:33-272(-)